MSLTKSLTRRELLKSAGAVALTMPLGQVRGPRERIDHMESRPLMQLRLVTSPTQEVGATPNGKLSIFPVTGGTFEGDRLRGKVLAGGGDWASAHADGTLELDLRVTLETDDGALIHMTFTGVRHDPSHYFRTLPRFETASPKYAFLNRLLAVGIGEIRPDGPVHVIEEIL